MSFAPGTVVVALAGPCAKDIGVVVSVDPKKHRDLIVRYPGNVYPYDLRSTHPSNLRLATAAEHIVRERAA